MRRHQQTGKTNSKLPGQSLVAWGGLAERSLFSVAYINTWLLFDGLKVVTAGERPGLRVQRTRLDGTEIACCARAWPTCCLPNALWQKKKKWVKRRRKRDSIAVDSHSYFLSSLQVTLFSLPTSFLYTCAAPIRIVGFRPFGDAPLIVRYPERMASLTLGLIFSLSLSLDSLSLSLFIHKYAFLPSGYCTALLTVLLLLPSQLRFLIWPYCLSIGHKIWTEIRNLPPPRHSSKSNFRKFFFSCEGNQLPNGLFRRASVGKAIRFCFAPRFD